MQKHTHYQSCHQTPFFSRKVSFVTSSISKQCPPRQKHSSSSIMCRQPEYNKHILIPSFQHLVVSNASHIPYPIVHFISFSPRSNLK